MSRLPRRVSVAPAAHGAATGSSAAPAMCAAAAVADDPGTFSSSNFWRGQFLRRRLRGAGLAQGLPELFGRKLEQLPPVRSRQAQAQEFVGRPVPPTTGTERPAVPIEPFQVEQSLRHLAVPPLLHPR